MNWQNSLLDHLQWSNNIINREEKEVVAKKIALKANSGDIIGVGSGSTVYLALFAIAQRIKDEHLNIMVIPSSFESSMTCTHLGIPQTTLLEKKPNWSFDGADEVDPSHNLIKGRGGAMFKEKLLMNNSPKNYIIIDRSKQVDHLGQKFPVPVEVFPLASLYIEEQLKKLGAKEISLRPAKGKDGAIITENGNFIIDSWFENIELDLEKNIKQITGVLESGLFIGYNSEIIIS